VMKSKGLARKKVVGGDVVNFTEDEVAFLTQSRLARVATASSEGQPHVVPVVYEFDGRAFYFTGWNLEKSLKFKNLVENKKVALVVDDVVTVSPWRPRGLEVRGVADLGSEGGRAYVKVTPLVKRSWGFR
jgi:pyridoxamine 5'-phosphate oxidase family protein